MPANKNAVIRYKFLDELLSDKHHNYSIEDITDKINDRLEDLGYAPVVTRTLEKDIVFLQERPFSIPLERYRVSGKACLRYSDKSFSIFSHELTEEEISLLSEVLNTVGQFNGLPNFDWLETLRTELGLKRQKQVLYFSNNPLLKNKNMLASLYCHIANEEVIKVVYKRFIETEPEQLTIHPYILKEYNSRWYLVGWDSNRDLIVTLAIDRLVSFSGVPEVTFKEYDGNIEDHFKNTIGITVYDDSSPEEILFWSSDAISPYIETKPFHSSQKALTDEDVPLREKYNVPSGGKFHSLNCTKNMELIQLLTRNFGDIIVLEPKSIKDDIKSRIVDMCEKYKKI